MVGGHLISTHFPYTTLFRSRGQLPGLRRQHDPAELLADLGAARLEGGDHLVPQPGQPVGERARLRRLPGTVAALEADEQRSEEHTSELQSRRELVCRLLLEK